MKYFVKYQDEKCHTHSEFFENIEKALKYFKKAEDKGYYVALYNCR